LWAELAQKFLIIACDNIQGRTGLERKVLVFILIMPDHYLSGVVVNVNQKA
jgi:hypothetical protein